MCQAKNLDPNDDFLPTDHLESVYSLETNNGDLQPNYFGCGNT